MYRIGIRDLCRTQNSGDMQVTLAGLCRPNTDRFICKLDIQGIPVSLRINGYILDTHLTAGSLDTQGNFPAVGNDNFVYHMEPLINNAMPLRDLKRADTKRASQRMAKYLIRSAMP